ncbi:MAG TPA: hypothetical protein VJ853_01270, partial [Thermoanaerobaculia bacterium]|nr:hypothetical protein [Thermoanaerobaculia bacterium]
MLPLRPQPQPAPRKKGGRVFIVWLVAVLAIIGIEWIKPPLRRLHVPTAIFTFVEFLCWLIVIALCLYGFAVFVRWLMRALFWRVGRRLFLSYLMIGLLPFFLFAILLLTTGYMVAGVMSHAALRNERQASLGQMESAALEYGLTGKKPPDALPSLEIYDTAASSGAKLPDWLKETTFSGMASRDGQPLLIASRQFPRDNAKARNVVLVQPIDRAWIDQLQDRTGIIIRLGNNTKTKSDDDINMSDPDMELMFKSIGRRVIWGDLTPLNNWATGESSDSHELFTLI